MTQDSLLIVFVKNLRKGKVKTRLAESVGEEKALQIYRRLLLHNRDVVVPLDIDIQVWYSDYLPGDDLWNQKRKVEKRVQQGTGLGSRMKHAMDSGFSERYRNVVIIGSDCGDLTTSILNEAFKKLKKHDVVIGPSRDGGYYLIGMSKRAPELFQNIVWSTPAVYKSTLERASEHSLSVYKLPQLNDIDTIEDWKEVAGKFDMRGV